MFKTLATIEDFKNADAIILGAGYGKSFTFRSGSDKGPEAIIKAFDNNLEIFDRFTLNIPDELFDFGYYNLVYINKGTEEEAVEKIKEAFDARRDKFMLMLGGTHTVSNGAFLHLAEKYNPANLTILQIDAHPDLRENTSDYKDGAGKYDHACVMRRCGELGFNIVQVGIRTYSIYDHEYIKSNPKIKIFEWGKGSIPKIEEIIKSIKTKDVYLTLDIDGLDPAHAPATGTPIPGGLEWFYAQKLIRNLIKDKNLISADIVEVAPFEDDVLTEYSAAQLAYNILSYKLLKDKGNLKFYFD